jgi:RimJ/RimL family protein N-acetyltransferase
MWAENWLLPDIGVQFRPFNSDDAEVFRFWYHDPELQAFFRGFIYGASRAECVNAPDIIKGYILMGLFENEVPFGCFTMCPTDTVMKNYNVGMLVSPHFGGLGCAHALGEAGVEWAFDRLGAQKITAKVVDPRFDKHLTDRGLVLEGVSRQSCFFNGKIYDEKVYSLLRTEYENVYRQRR